MWLNLHRIVFIFFNKLKFQKLFSYQNIDIDILTLHYTYINNNYAKKKMNNHFSFYNLTKNKINQ